MIEHGIAFKKTLDHWLSTKTNIVPNVCLKVFNSATVE